MKRTAAALSVAALLTTPVSWLAAAGSPPLTAQSTTQKPPPPRTQKPAPQKPAPPKPAAPKPAPAPEPPPATDVRVKTAYTQGAQVSENTTYLQGQRQRVEFPGVVTLNQCDLKRTVMLNPAAKKFRVREHPAPAAATPAPAPADPMQVAMMGGAPPPQPKGGVITMTTTLADTLERQQMFGLEARRVKTTIVKQASEKACDKSPLTVEIDAWYVDLPAQAACAIPPVAPPPPAADPDACTDRVETRTVGDAKLGFPVKTTTTTITGEGDKVERISVAEEVTELEITRLDRALFDVPKDYTEAASVAEVVPVVANGGTIGDALFGSTADGTSRATTKKAGVIRIGVLEPVNKTDRSFPLSALRQEVASRFTRAPYEAIPVAGAAPESARAEAARLECDFMLVSEIAEAKTSKPSRIGGALRRVSGEGAREIHEVKVLYSLVDVKTGERTKMAGEAKGSSGNFGVGSALRLAAFAGRLYFGFMMMGGGLGMNPMMMQAAGSSGPLGSFFDPRATAMNSIAMGLDGSVMTGSEAEMRETASEAFANTSKSVVEALQRRK